MGNLDDVGLQAVLSLFRAGNANDLAERFLSDVSSEEYACFCTIRQKCCMEDKASVIALNVAAIVGSASKGGVDEELYALNIGQP